MIPAGVLCYRDDTGRTQAEKLAQRFRWFRDRPALATFLVMAAILNVAYFFYGAGFAAIRASKLATSVACPWPFPEAKVYDPRASTSERGSPAPSSRATGPLDDRPAERTSGREPGEADGHCRPDRALSRGASSSRARRAGSASRPRPPVRARMARRRRDALARRGARAPARGDGRRRRYPRLIGVRLDLEDPSSIARGREGHRGSGGAPDALVHNAGIAAVGCVEDMPFEVWEQLFRTNLFGPVRLTKAAAAVDAGGRARADRRGLEPGRHSRHAVDQRLLGLQGRARTLGRSPGGGDRAVRPRRHRPRRRNIQDRDHHRADAPRRGSGRAVRPSLREDRAHGPRVGGSSGGPARTFAPRSPGLSTSAPRSRDTRWASTPAC